MAEWILNNPITIVGCSFLVIVVVFLYLYPLYRKRIRYLKSSSRKEVTLSDYEDDWGNGENGEKIDESDLKRPPDEDRIDDEESTRTSTKELPDGCQPFLP